MFITYSLKLNNFSFSKQKRSEFKSKNLFTLAGSSYILEASQTLLHHLKIQQRDEKSTLVKLSETLRKTKENESVRDQRWFQ